MSKFQQVFRVGDQGINRRGWYTVLSFDDGGMWVRYEDSQVMHLGNFEVQMRILENIVMEHSAANKEHEWERGYTSDEEDVEVLVQATEKLLVPPLQALIRSDTTYGMLREAGQKISGDCHVYAILLSKLSRQMRWGFHAMGSPSMPCIYVGQSWHAPEERFNMHLSGTHSSYFVNRFGLALLPGVYEPFHSLSRDVAMAAEAALADALGQLGCTVFGGH